MSRTWAVILALASLALAIASFAAEPKSLAKRARPQSGEQRAEEPLDRLCQLSADQLKRKLGDDCATIVRPPFVIAGDMTVKELEEWHSDTIRPAAEAMANTYFRVAPSQPITVLLFTGEANYNEYAERLFGEKTISVYGYYRPNQRTLVMNISTGSGTLMHELTHALMDFDFPKVPDWFNEGLASLHEQCRFRKGDEGPWIEGLENWRLAGLQKTIRAKRLRPLKTMIEADDFRGDLEGTNYAQARYLCLYMQRKGVLAKFYQDFHSSQAKDALGVSALEQAFSDTPWKEFDRDFQAWVMTLKR